MNHLLQEITPLISSYGLWVIFFGMMIEGTTMILVAGILAYLGMLPVGETILVAIAGAVAGDQLWYFLGKRYTARLLKRFPSVAARVERLADKVRQKGNLLAFASRFVYSGAILFPVALGVYDYPHRKFTFFDLLGVTLWACVGVAIGYFLGTGVEQLFGKIEKVKHLLWLLAIVAFVVWNVKRYLNIRKEPLF